VCKAESDSKLHTNDFAEGSKILLDADQKIILLVYQNNFVEILKIMSNAAKNFDILATSLSVLRNYFDNSTKLFSDLYPVKIYIFQPFFLCRQLSSAIRSINLFTKQMQNM